MSPVYGENIKKNPGKPGLFFRLAVHILSELFIVLGAPDLIEQEFHSFDRIKVAEDFSEDPNFIEFVFFEKKFFSSGA